ncbi:MAG: ABC transporter ATP-binding protein [Acetobacteraceae bacterium]|nr:ABC transporter ATP-binding protein [Acetobacteraceae bacterium]
MRLRTRPAATIGSAAEGLPVGPVAFLLGYVKRHLPLSAAALAVVISGALCAVSAQYGLKLLVDGMTAPPHEGRERVFLSLALFLSLLALESACWRLGGWLGSRAVIKVGEDIRLGLFDSVAARSWQFFNGQASGALAGRIVAAATAGAAVLRTVVWNVLPPLMDLAGSVVVLATIDARIAAGLVVVAGAATWALHRLGGRGFPLHEAYHREAAEVSGNLADVLAHIGLVQACGARHREGERLARLMALEGAAHARSWMFLERLRCGHDAAFWLATAIVLTAAVWEWSRGAITTGGVVVASTLTLRVLMGSRELGLSLLGLAQQLGAVAEAISVLQARPSGEDAALQRRRKLKPLRARAGEIEIKGLRYAPESGGRPLFQGLDVQIPAGQRVGIVGPSGAGKSTLLRLIQGVVLPDRGDVLLDQQHLAAVAPDSLADAFAVVTQEVPLLHRSIAENLRYGRPGASWDEAVEAARAVGADAFIRALPQGYNTVVGERGFRLSGGQRQRLAIARALLRHEAPVLMLDEATSALDSYSELIVHRALLARVGERCRTVLAVAHRLSTVMDFDRVIVLHEGRLVEDGPPGELVRSRTGHFASTWHLQQRAFGMALAEQEA